MTQRFGCPTVALEPFDPYCPTHHFHSGIDLAAAAGTPVLAAAPGLARVGYDATACGLFIDVTVDAHIRVLYCHLSSIAVRDPRVTPGALIGRVGATGLATGPHLHLEVDVDGRAVDPVRWLAGP